MVSASQSLTSSIGEGKALDGSAFNAGKDLFSALIIPTIGRASSVFDDTKKHLSQYESANEEVSGEGVLDEDKLNAKKFSTEAIKAATDDTASTFRAMASAADAASLYSVASSLSEAAQSLENYSESLQQDLDKIEDKLRKLYKFNSAVNGLFNDDLNNFKLAMQSVTVLNDTVVDSKTGSYTLPEGTDESWFTNIVPEFVEKKKQNISIPSILYNYDRDSKEYSIQSQNMLVDLSQQWFDAKTEEDKREIERELLYFRARNKDSDLDINFDKAMNNILGGVLGQLVLYPVEASEAQLNCKINKLGRSKGLYCLGSVTSVEPGNVRVFRVEGKINERIVIGDNGEVAIIGKDRTLFLNFGQIGRANDFLATRLGQGMKDSSIKSFEVSQSFLDKIRSEAIRERDYKRFGKSLPGANRGRRIE